MLKDDLEKEFYALRELKGNIKSDIFQERIMKPIHTELEKVKNAYDCETLRELATMKGKKQGLTFLIKLFKRIHTDYQNKYDELKEIDDSSK